MGKDITNVKIFIIGFAFKGNPETSDLRGSSTLDLLSKLRLKKVSNNQIFGYDFVVNPKEIEALEINYSELQEGFDNADIVIIMNNHNSHKNIDIFSLIDKAKQDLILWMVGIYLIQKILLLGKKKWRN